MDTVFPDDIQIMYEIKMKLDMLESRVEKNRTDTIEVIIKINDPMHNTVDDNDETTKEIVKAHTLQKKWEEFKHIHKYVTEYVEKHCQHKFVDDYIDTSPDSGMNIRYCTYCYKNG